ncbi:MAG: hypothetical protein QXZ34_03505, partial [Candidatus Bathyarchaeia archaeon]
ETALRKKGFCEKCVYFIAHDIYGYLGLCVKKNALVTSTMDRSCKKFRDTSLKELEKLITEKGWLYCLTCKKPIYSFEELKEHLNDQVSSDFLSDDVASEEAPSAD